MKDPIKIKKLLYKVSLGEATEKDRELLSSIPDDVFYSGLEELKSMEYGGSNESYKDENKSSIDELIDETKEEILEIESSYSEVVAEPPNIGKVKSYAKNRALVKRFVMKQRVKK